MNNHCRIFLLLMAALLHFGCANKVTPGGGVKDVVPPVLLSAEPANDAVNFSSREIVLTFDEYIQLKEIGKQLVISPPIQPAPVIEIRKKSIVITPGDSLAPNTTYTINFGDAIADNNEGNALPGFRYVFSTGSYIDSLIIKGRIVDALTAKPQDGSLALMYDAATPDSLLLKKLPDYFSRADKGGRFQIRNIRPGRYKLFALMEKNNNYIFDQPDELAGFIPQIFELSDSAEFEIGVALQPVQKQSVKSGSIQEPGKLQTVFSKPVSALTWKFQGVQFENVIPEYSTLNDTVYLYCFPPPSDTLSVVWYDNGITVDTVRYQKQRGAPAAAAKKISGYMFYPGKGAMLHPETTPFVKWWAPVMQSDFSKISFKKDSVDFPVNGSFSDTLKTVMKFDALWKEGAYTVTILPGAVTDSYNATNDTIITLFSIPAEKTKGSVSFNFMMLQPGAHLLQLVNEKDETVRQRTFEQKVSGVFEQVDPGTYRLRVITDTNKNNRWDGGDYVKAVMPEEVRYYKEALVVRSNWEVEVEWVQ